MATLTIRNLDDELKSRLRVRAAERDHSMEEEARLILRSALTDTEDADGTIGIASRIRRRLEDAGGVHLQLPERNERPHVPENLE